MIGPLRLGDKITSTSYQYQDQSGHDRVFGDIELCELNETECEFRFFKLHILSLKFDILAIKWKRKRKKSVECKRLHTCLEKKIFFLIQYFCSISERWFLWGSQTHTSCNSVVDHLSNTCAIVKSGYIFSTMSPWMAENLSTPPLLLFFFCVSDEK